MKKFLLILIAVIFISLNNISAQTAGDAGLSGNKKVSMRSTPLMFEGFIIEPNSQFINETVFVNKIKKAITLLKERSPDEYQTMKTYIGKIRATRASGANYNEEIMTIEIAKTTFDASLEWLASTLIHETHHIKKYKDTGKKYGDAALMTDKKAAFKVMVAEELECNAVQLIALQNVGGAQFEIDHLKAQKGDHFDIDKDGDYDWDDYNMRDWE